MSGPSDSEWEYATAIRDSPSTPLYDFYVVAAPLTQREIDEWVAEDRRGWMRYPPERTLVNVRRVPARQAGPWEPVP